MTNITSTSCNGPSNGDVWYKFIVPSSGSVIIETDAVNLTNEDLGMALYTGSSCNSLSYYGCYPNGSTYSQYMPRAELTGLTPNATMYVGGNSTIIILAHSKFALQGQVHQIVQLRIKSKLRNSQPRKLFNNSRSRRYNT